MMPRRRRHPPEALSRWSARRGARGLAAVEAALGFAIVGSVLAVAVPTFLRELHASRFSEATEGLSAIGEGAMLYATTSPSVDKAFPASAPWTPLRPPRGVRAADPPGLWQSPTWLALHFPPPHGSGRAFAEGDPHSFSFGFDSTLSPSRSSFLAHAHGDLNGNDTTSTFEVRGHDDVGGPALDPGMYVQDPLE
jgi:type II secretory pathway pseudopilin PulG